jgi:hypothetical protein
MQYAASATGMETPLLDGISSVASSGLATPGMVDLRKGIRYGFKFFMVLHTAIDNNFVVQMHDNLCVSLCVYFFFVGVMKHLICHNNNYILCWNRKM